MRHDSPRRNGSFPGSLHTSGRTLHRHSWPEPGLPPAFKEPVEEQTIRSGKIQIERKLFIFTLKENPRGRFLRITEEAKGRRNSVIFPATGLEDVKRILDDLLSSGADAP